jgi:hypothetical protein
MLKPTLAFTIALALTTTPALAEMRCKTFAGVISAMRTTCFSADPACFDDSIITRERHYTFFGRPLEICHRHGRPIFCGDR